MTQRYVSPCVGCGYETSECSLVGECRYKKLAGLKEAEENAEKQKSKLIPVDYTVVSITHD